MDEKSVKILILFLIALLIIPGLSASLSSNINIIKEYVDDYNSGEINAPQLVVYLDYVRNKMYEELDIEKRKAFTEAEISRVFDKIEGGKDDMSEYKKEYLTDNFKIIFSAHAFYEYDKDYWEKRESVAEKLYSIDYELRAINVESFGDLSEEVSSFIDDLEDLVENEGSTADEEELRKDWNKIKQRFWELRDQDECEKVFEEIGMTEEENNYGKDKKFTLAIKQINQSNCWNEPGKCHEECEEYEVCDDCEPECHTEEDCWEECEGEGENQTCSEACEEYEVCSGCENAECHTEKDCWQECDEEGEEHCDEWPESEVRLEGNCREDGSDIWIGAWGEYEHYQGINEGGEWTCDSEVEALVQVRKVLQKDLNEDFIEWYFEEFLTGEDYDKIINGGGGLSAVLWLLIKNEEEIADRLHCYEPGEWPEGFDKLDFTYESDNAHLEIWEKLAPVEWDNKMYYTTLFKYSWIPDKELMKGLINYKMEQLNTFGPTAKDIAEIKSDEGQMELIRRLSEKYGGSFDIKLELKEKDGEFEVLKYLQINPDVAVQIVDSIEERPDISVEVNYDVLYDFINYMSYKMEGDRIQGPHWVRVEDEGGPGKFFSALGAISKMWREGVSIKPRFALIKLLFSTKDLVELFSTDSGGFKE